MIYTIEAVALQRVDQALDRLASGDHELVYIEGYSIESETQFDALVKASAELSFAVGHKPTQWEERQKKRLPSKFHEQIRRAVNTCRDAEDVNADAVLASLSSLGFAVMDPAIDPISKNDWTDVPSLRPLHGQHSTWAGVGSNLTNPVFQSKSPEVLNCNVELRVKLSPSQRGAHMSRLQSSLLAADSREYSDLDEYIASLAEETLSKQECEGVQLAIEAPIRFHLMTRKSKLPSFVKGVAGLTAEFDATGDVLNASRSLTLDIATACPCTLRYSRLKTANILGADNVELVPPTFTHSQPGKVELEVCGLGELPKVSFVEMFSAAGTGAHLREAVLKRPDEHDLVERMHRRPQFAEDVVRAVAMELASFSELGTRICIRAELDESIHPHKAYAACSGVAEDFWRNG